MGATEDVAIVRLRPGDALAALVLSTEAQWNQNEADWQFFLVHGIVFGAMTPDAGLVATAALLPYTEGNAWISMVLVTASQRRGLNAINTHGQAMAIQKPMRGLSRFRYIEYGAASGLRRTPAIALALRKPGSQ